MRKRWGLFLLAAILCADESAQKLKQQADAYLDDNRYRRAIEVYEKIIQPPYEWSGDQRSRIINNLGYCHYKLRRYEEACSRYRQALEIDGRYFLCLNNMAASLMKLEKYDESLSYLERALALDPKAIKVLFNLFVAHAHLRHEEQAKGYLRQALAIDESYTLKRFKDRNVSDRQIQAMLRELRKEK